MPYDLEQTYTHYYTANASTPLQTLQKTGSPPSERFDADEAVTEETLFDSTPNRSPSPTLDEICPPVTSCELAQGLRREQFCGRRDKLLAELDVNAYDDDDENDEFYCCGCLAIMSSDLQTVRMLPCRHAFHDSCILRWLEDGNRSCPLCLREIKGL